VSLTPLEEIETAVHSQFDEVPTAEQAAEVIRKRTPQMDLGVTIAIAALVLQGWQLWREEQDRRRARAGSTPSNCPQCGHPEVRKDANGRRVCDQGHAW
jgi:hypothetical protein